MVAAEDRAQLIQQRVPTGQTHQRLLVEPDDLSLRLQCLQRRLSRVPAQAALFEQFVGPDRLDARERFEQHIFRGAARDALQSFNDHGFETAIALDWVRVHNRPATHGDGR